MTGGLYGWAVAVRSILDKEPDHCRGVTPGTEKHGSHAACRLYSWVRPRKHEPSQRIPVTASVYKWHSHILFRQSVLVCITLRHFPSVNSSRLDIQCLQTMSTVKCQSDTCPNGNPPSRLECPTCNKCVSTFLYIFHLTLYIIDWVFEDPSSVAKNVSKQDVSMVSVV